jgi:DNA-binding PadR family transcriptional regulator
MPPQTRPSPLGLAVLGLLYGGPLHPYRMQRLLKEWGKDQVVNVGQRSSLYKTIGRLSEAGLVAVRQTERNQQYPERTVYEITQEGRAAIVSWLVELLSIPRNEYPAFPAALSFAMLLGPDGLLEPLRARAAALGATAAELRGALRQHGPALPRIALLELEYQLAMAEAELRWVERVVEQLAGGSLSWSEQDFAGAAAAYEPDQEPSD